jgi:hypothetical protein
MQTTAQIECVHGYPEGCPDCDVANYLPVQNRRQITTGKRPPHMPRIDDEPRSSMGMDGWMAAPNPAPENFPGGG